jgi:hypothetical protein
MAFTSLSHISVQIGRYMDNKMDDEKMNEWLQNDLHLKDPNHRATICGTMRKWTAQHL